MYPHFGPILSFWVKKPSIFSNVFVKLLCYVDCFEAGKDEKSRQGEFRRARTMTCFVKKMSKLQGHPVHFDSWNTLQIFAIQFKLAFPTGRDSETFRDNGTEIPSLSRDKGTTGQAKILAKETKVFF